jgi:nucleotide-binding universal stress UspA family protein
LPKGLLQQNLVQARADLKALADEAGADSEVLSGHAPLRILEYAKTIAADLIVLGSHRPGLQDYFLGSTAARVVRHAECAVLVHR